MKRTSPRMVLDFDGDRLMAIDTDIQGGQARVRSWATCVRPSSVDPAESSQVGRWIAESLAERAMRAGPMVVAVRRGEVVLKRLTLPAGVEGDEGDLAGMVRIQMSKQMAVSMEGSAVDYVRLGSDGETVVVLAGAIPGERLRWIHGVAETMRRRIGRIGLRACGAAAMLSDASRRRAGPVLGIAPGWESTEFVVVEDGRLVFARAVDVGLPEDLSNGPALAEFTDRLAVEAKRTWMSYRVSPESGEVQAVATVGRGRAAEDIARTCAQALEIPFEDAETYDTCEYPEEMPEGDRLVAAPLAALLVEASLTEPTFDFAHPRKAPDRMAARRQVALLAMFAGIVVIGSLYVAGSIHLSRVDGDLANAREKLASLDAEYRAFLGEDARLKHLQAWSEPEADWIAHLRALSDLAPDPREAQIDDVQGTMTPWVTFTPREGRYTNGRWESGQGVRLTVAGVVKERRVADEFRGRLVDGSAYRVSTRGPDEPSRFSLDLTTEESAPTSSASSPGHPGDAAAVEGGES